MRGSSFCSIDSCCTVDNTHNSKLGSKSEPSVAMDSCKVMKRLQEEEEYDTDHNIMHEECSACPFCEDQCEDDCGLCLSSSKFNSSNDLQCAVSPHRSLSSRQKPLKSYTICQVRRHNSKVSAWLVAGDRIYDATQYVARHPGGERSILKYAGGVKDCTEDMNFHSKNAVKLWKRFEIGILVKCPSENVFESYEDESVDSSCVIS